MSVKKRLDRQAAETFADHSPALAWLSLVGLLSSRARFRFTRRYHYIQRENTHTGLDKSGFIEAAS